MHRGGKGRRGFTLLELGVTVVIIAILAVLVVGGISKLRARAQRVKCATNLRNLAVAGNFYIDQHGSWPQIRQSRDTDPKQHAQAWIDALAPFGATRETWICPTIQNLLENPDYLTPETARIDYMATPFDDKTISPREWPRQPWFIERGDVHGSGNLIIFTDGSISDLKTVVQGARRKR